MSYTWQDGEIITADKLNNTGNVMMVGINIVSDTKTQLDHTWQEIFDMIAAGNFVYIRGSGEDYYSLNPIGSMTKSSNSYSVSTLGHDYYWTNSPDGYPFSQPGE